MQGCPSNNKTKGTTNRPDWNLQCDTKLQQGGCKPLLSFDGRDHKLLQALQEPANTTKVKEVKYETDQELLLIHLITRSYNKGYPSCDFGNLIPLSHRRLHLQVFLYLKLFLMILGVASHQLMSRLLAAKKQKMELNIKSLNKITLTCKRKEHVSITLCLLHHLIHWEQADNIWFPEWIWRFHIKIPWNQLNTHLIKGERRGKGGRANCQWCSIHLPFISITPMIYHLLKTRKIPCENHCI